METFTLVIALVTLIVTTTILHHLRRVPSRDEIQRLTVLMRTSSPKALVETIEAIHPGATKSEVESLLGKPDKPSPDEWVYFLGRDAGYLISFAGNDRVDRVRSWKS
jgi:hypothetical protein